MEIKDYSALSLTPDEKAAFQKFAATDRAILTDAERKCLYRLGFLKGTNGWLEGLPEDGKYELNDDGKRYREFLRSKKSADRKEARRWRITTAIALVALVKSFWPELIALIRLLL